MSHNATTLRPTTQFQLNSGRRRITIANVIFARRHDSFAQNAIHIPPATDVTPVISLPRLLPVSYLSPDRAQASSPISVSLGTVHSAANRFLCVGHINTPVASVDRHWTIIRI